MTADPAQAWLRRAMKEQKAELGWYCCTAKVGGEPSDPCPSGHPFPSNDDLFHGHGLESIRHSITTYEVYSIRDAVTP